MTLRDQSIRGYLAALGRRRAAPTGGAAAALCVAQASALVAMVARSAAHTSGGVVPVPPDAAASVVAACEELVAESMDLMEEDAASVDALMSALSLPGGSSRLEAARSKALQDARAAAIGPQLGILGLAARLVGLMEDLAPSAASGIRVDLAAAAEITGAALSVARLNVEANAGSVSDADRLRQLEDALVDGDRAMISTRDLVDRISGGQ